MALSHNPRIVTDNLALCIDAANRKSFNSDTNLFTYSEDFNNGAWAKNSVTISSNAVTGPTVNGVTLVADKIQETAVTSQFLVSQNPYTAVAGDVNTVSVYAKAGERTQLTITSWGDGYDVFNLDTGTVYQTGGHVCTITPVGGGWYRCSATITEVNVTTSRWYIGMWKNNAASYAGTVGEGLYLAGAQFEKNRPAVGNYIKTVASTIAESTTWSDVSGNQRHFTVFGSPRYNPAGYFTLANNQTTQYMWRVPFETSTDKITYSCWFRSNFTSPGQTPFTYSVNGNNEMLFYITNATTLSPHPKGVGYNITTTNMTDVWVNFAWSRDSVTGTNVFYRDGVEIGTYTASAGVQLATGGHLIIGQEADAPGGGFTADQNLDGDFARLDVYSRVLSADEIKQNFNALRGRYGA